MAGAVGIILDFEPYRSWTGSTRVGGAASSYASGCKAGRNRAGGTDDRGAGVQHVGKSEMGDVQKPPKSRKAAISDEGVGAAFLCS